MVSFRLVAHVWRGEQQGGGLSCSRVHVANRSCGDAPPLMCLQDVAAVTIQAATSVSHCLWGSFTAPRRQLLTVAGGRLNVYDLSASSRLQLCQSVMAVATVRDIKSFRRAGDCCRGGVCACLGRTVQQSDVRRCLWCVCFVQVMV